LQEENVIITGKFWKSEEELEKHFRSEEYRNLQLLMEMALQQPEVRFGCVANTTGIEAIEKARMKTGRGKRA
jgi:hypothetical protein